MSREVQVRFCESRGVRFPPATHLVAHCDTEEQARVLRAAIAARLGALGLELHPLKTKIVYCKDANRRGDFEPASFDFLGYTFRGRLAKGPRGLFHWLQSGHQRQGEEGERQADQGLAPQPPQWHGPIRPRGPDQPASKGLDQLLRSLLPLRVALPRMADQRAPHPVGHAEVQTIPRQVRQSDGLAAKGLRVQAWPIRSLAAHRVHLRPDCGGRMTGDCHVRS